MSILWKVSVSIPDSSSSQIPSILSVSHLSITDGSFLHAPLLSGVGSQHDLDVGSPLSHLPVSGPELVPHQ